MGGKYPKAVRFRAYVWGLTTSSPKPRRDAIDGQEQCRELILRRLLGRRRAMAPQQLDLLAVHLVQRGQAVRQPLAELREALREHGAAGEAAHDGHRPMGFVGDQRKKLP